MEPSAGGKRLVVFSLGNLVSNQDFDDVNGTKRDGLLVELELVRDTVDGPVRLESVKGVPVATENRLGGGKKRNVQAVLLDVELLAIEERLVELAGRPPKEVKKERAELLARRKVAMDRRERIASFVPEGVLPPMPSPAP